MGLFDQRDPLMGLFAQRDVMGLFAQRDVMGLFAQRDVMGLHAASPSLRLPPSAASHPKCSDN